MKSNKNKRKEKLVKKIIKKKLFEIKILIPRDSDNYFIYMNAKANFRNSNFNKRYAVFLKFYRKVQECI